MSATPTRDIESRLTAALHARADQVTHDDLTTLLVPKASRSRRPAVIAAGVAAAVAAAIVAVPLLGQGGDGGTEPQPAPAPDPTPSVIEQARGEVTLDIDGDGKKDRAYLEDGELRLEASTGTQVGVPVPAGSILLPPVTDAGTPHPLVVAVPPTGAGVGALLTFRDDRTDTLVADDLPESLSIGPGTTAWVDDIGALMVGEYDAEVPDDQRVLVSATAYRAARNGSLVEYGAGDLCWDRTTNEYPVDCTQLPAQDADPSLMFPMVGTGSGIGDRSGMFDGEYESAELVRRGATGLELVVTWDGVEHRTTLPDSDTATLLDAGLVGGGGDMPAFVVAQDYGESTSFNVISWYDGKYRIIPTSDEGGWLGSGFVDDQGQVFQSTWLSQSGVLWTARRIDPDQPDRYDLIRWSDKIGPTLVPVDQGETCLDLDQGRKLDDATCGAS